MQICSEASTRVGLTHSSVVPEPLDSVFAWHERPGALARLLPPWQPVRIAQETTSLAEGRTILRLPGGVRWVADHCDFDPPNRFVDELVSLPIRWRHTHSFEAETGTSTRVTDRVDSPVPARWLHQLFLYRHRQLADDLSAQAAMTAYGDGPITVAMTGASGLIGSALTALLTTAGHRVVKLVRRPARTADEREWRPEHPDPAALAGTDALVHLAGASIAGRFSAAHKRAILDSRVGPTARLSATLAQMGTEAPSAFVVASAIGYYGARHDDEWLDEAGSPGHDFLAGVVREWESATEPAAAAGVRVVKVRTGIVQSARGGTLRLLRPLFEIGLGGRLGSGGQWTSWIDIDDLTDVFFRAIVDARLEGPVNAVAPHPVTNREYSSVLASVLHRPAMVPVPGLGPRLILGRQGTDELALASQRVHPERLRAVGHAFRHPVLEQSLRHQLGKLES
jgi:hypothetical protein